MLRQLSGFESRHLQKIRNEPRTGQHPEKKYKKEAFSPPGETFVIQNADYLRFSYFCGYLYILSRFAPTWLSWTRVRRLITPFKYPNTHNFLKLYLCFDLLKGFFGFLYFIQHCFICRKSDTTLSEDAGIEPRIVAKFVTGSQTL